MNETKERENEIKVKELKREREKMAKALRMERKISGNLNTGNITLEHGYNGAVQDFNEAIDNYLKKEVK